MIQLLDREGTRLSLSHRVDTCTIPRFMSKERGKECQAGSQCFWEKSLIFFLRVLAVGSGEEQGTQSEDTTKLMFRSNLLFILSLSFTTLACIRVASFLFFLFPPSFPPSFFPVFPLSTFLHWTQIHWRLQFVQYYSQSWSPNTHPVPSCILWPWVFVFLQLTPLPLFLHEAF